MRVRVCARGRPPLVSIARVAFFRSWTQGGQPTLFWFSGFFFAQGFLTGVRQNHARLHSVPIDTVQFDFEVSHLRVLYIHELNGFVGLTFKGFV